MYHSLPSAGNMPISSEKINFGQLKTYLLRGKLCIVYGILGGFLWAMFFGLLTEKKSIYQKAMFFEVAISEQVYSLRKGDIERYVYGETFAEQAGKERRDRQDLYREVMLIITEPGESNKQVEKFKIFVRGNTLSETEFRSERMEKELYEKLTGEVLSVLSERIDNLTEIMSRSAPEEFLKLYAQRRGMRQYKRLISEGKTPILKEISQSRPEVIWQIPNVLVDLPSALLIGLLSGIVLAGAYGKISG